MLSKLSRNLVKFQMVRKALCRCTDTPGGLKTKGQLQCDRNAVVKHPVQYQGFLLSHTKTDVKNDLKCCRSVPCCQTAFSNLPTWLTVVLIFLTLAVPHL